MTTTLKYGILIIRRALSDPRRTYRLDVGETYSVSACGEESGLPEYNDGKNKNHTHICHISKRRLTYYSSAVMVRLPGSGTGKAVGGVLTV